MRYQTSRGDLVDIIDKTRPTAAKDYPCCWEPSHTINKGDRYVRVVFKQDDEFKSDHICLDCWCGHIVNGE